MSVSETDAAGTLWVAPGDLVTATYVDLDDGLGGTNVTKTANAVIDCASPVISNVAPISVERNERNLDFVTRFSASFAAQSVGAAGLPGFERRVGPDRVLELR